MWCSGRRHRGAGTGSQSLPLFESQMVILASRYHPLAGRGAVTLADLDSARWALHQPGTGIRQAADLLLRRLGSVTAFRPTPFPRT